VELRARGRCPVSDDILGHAAEILGGAAAIRQVEAEGKAVDALDFPLRCDAKVHGSRCQRPAEFAGRCKSGGCAGTIGLICGVCLDAAALRQWTCKTCQTSGWFPDVHALTPLGAS
jgi:hypothetical protein